MISMNYYYHYYDYYYYHDYSYLLTDENYVLKIVLYIKMNFLNKIYHVPNESSFN